MLKMSETQNDGVTRREMVTFLAYIEVDCAIKTCVTEQLIKIIC